MDSKSMTRKDFFVLTFSLMGSAVVASNCGSSGGGGGTGGSTGSGGSGSGGSNTGVGGGTGTGGHPGTGGSTAGTGGSGAGGAGTGGSTGQDAGSDTRDATVSDTGNDVPANVDGRGDVGGGDASNGCTLPLPEEQLTVAASDIGTHVHTLVIDAGTLNATTAQTVNTGVTNNHSHAVTFAPTDLTSLRGGGTVTILSATGLNAADAAVNHTHTYRVSCHPLPDAGGQ